VSAALRALSRDALGELPEDCVAWLRALGGPVAIQVPGRDRSRARALTTLLHGNEPSGVRALHAWLRRGATPAVDALLVVANVEAALAPPGFAHRMLPGRRDLNRCFLGPFEGAEGHLAREILDAVAGTAPEALVDLHNNTGHNPPYAVGRAPDAEVLCVAALFADRFVTNRLRLGALMEALDFPCATLEVGRSGDPAADAVALSGLERFLERDDVTHGVGAPLVQVLAMSMRAELRPGVRLAVADAPRPDADFTLHADLDQHNFERVEAGTPLGWCRDDACPLVLRDENGKDRSAEYFAVEAGRLRARRPLVPIMITTDPTIAAADCLFYVVEEAGRQGERR
jgi:hypothetical protein